MGLLNYIKNNYDSKNNKSGLLKKADNFLHMLSAFEKLSINNNLDKIAILEKFENYYLIKYSYNFTDASIQQSMSTHDFWVGTLTNNNWNTFSNENAIPFMQLLSQKDKETIENFCIKRLNDDYIILIPFKDNNNYDLLKIENDIKNFLYDYKKTILQGLHKYKNGALLIINSDTYSIDDYFLYIKKIICKDDLCIKSKNYIKLVLFSDDEIDIELYKYQIVKTLSNFNTQFNSIKLDIQIAGYSNSYIDIKTFIEQE